MDYLAKFLRCPDPGGVDIYHYQAPWYLSGDVNGDWNVTIGDVVHMINFLFKHGPDPFPALQAGDINCNGVVDIGDVIYLINYLFKGGPAPSC